MKDVMRTETWMAWILAAIIHSAAAIIFLFSTFVTQKAHADFVGFLEHRLESIEHKLDQLLDLKQKGDK